MVVGWHFTTWAVVVAFVVGDDVGQPLIVTPLLDEGRFEEAQAKALVTPDLGGVRNYTGFFNVNKKCGNNLFFWFYPAEKNWEFAPVLIWVNTFSSRSVLVEMFLEVGPFDYDRKKGFVKREYSWCKENNVVFLDYAVGCGFSFTEKDCNPDSLNTTSREVKAAVVQFFKLFPTLYKNPFFIVGQNLAGKHAPGFVLEIGKFNKNAKKKINLVGIIIGDPWLDRRCHFWYDYSYHLGIIDKKDSIMASNYENEIGAAIDAGDYRRAYKLINNYPAVQGAPPIALNILYEYAL